MGRAVDQARALYYDLPEPAEFATGSAVDDRQVAIGIKTNCRRRG